jgi:hypothetical protein
MLVRGLRGLGVAVRWASRLIVRVVAGAARLVARRTRAGWSRLRALGVRGVIRLLIGPLIGIGLLVFALVEAHRVLRVGSPPKASPPLLAALAPESGLHTTNNGYVISVSLSLSNCRGPVHGDVSIVLPTEYWKTERAGYPKLVKALVGLAADDPSIEIQYIRPGDWQINAARRSSSSWQTAFSNQHLVGGTGRVAAVRLDDWAKRPESVDVQFTIADWLVRRGYGSCWLRLPRLTGAGIPNLSVLAADAGSIAFGRASGATSPGTSSSSSSDFTFTGPNGRTTAHSSTAKHVDYLGSGVPASIGYVTVQSPMGLIPSDNQGPAPGVGQPHWSCAAPPGRHQYELFPSGVDSDGEFRYFTPPALRNFATASLADCSGVIALAEPGSQSRRDLWLLIIGAALSTGVALLIGAVLPVAGHRRNAANSGQPDAQASAPKRGPGKRRRSSR